MLNLYLKVSLLQNDVLTNIITNNEYDAANEYVVKYQIPLTKKQLRNYCSNNSAEELEWYIRNKDKISDFDKERMKEITNNLNVLKEYLDCLDFLFRS